MTRAHPLASIESEGVVILDDGVAGRARLQGEAPSSGELSNMAVMDRGATAQELREQFDRRGYICIPGLFEADDVDAAREAVFSKLKSVGEVTGDPVAGVYSGTSNRRDGRRDLGQGETPLSIAKTLSCKVVTPAHASRRRRHIWHAGVARLARQC